MPALAALVLAACALAGCGDGSAAEPDQVFRAALRPLNGSGVEGSAVLSQTGSTVRVHLSAVGLEPRQEHVQHVHRLEGGGPGACPDGSADRDADGTLALDESLPAYGEVAVPLEPFPRTGDGGSIEYDASLELEPEVEPLSDRVVALYGLEMDGVYDPTVPVACGRLR